MHKELIEQISQFWAWLGENDSEIIAICAVFIAAYQAYATRKHNKLSVKPHLNDFRDKESNSKQLIYTFTLNNNGLGPAIIKEWKVYVDGKALDSNDHEYYEKKAREIIPEKINDVVTTRLGANYALPSNDTIKLLYLMFYIHHGTNFDGIEKNLARLDIYVRYESIYGNTYYLDSRESRDKLDI